MGFFSMSWLPFISIFMADTYIANRYEEKNNFEFDGS